MARALRCLASVCVVVWLALRTIVVRTGWIPPVLAPAAGWTLLATASLAAAAVVLLVALGARRAIRSQRTSHDPWLALGQGVAVPLPHGAAALVVLQLRVWGSLVRWMLRLFPEDEGAFSYSRRTAWRPVLALALGIAAASAAAVVYFVPELPVRMAMLGALAWGLTSLAGAYASLIVHPHTYDSEQLVLCYGVLATACVPTAYIVDVESERRRNSEQHRSGVRVTKNGGAVSLAHRGRTDVTVRLSTPVAVRRLTDRTAPVMTLRAAVDDPERFVESVRRSCERPREAGGVRAPETNPIDRLWSTQRA